MFTQAHHFILLTIYKIRPLQYPGAPRSSFGMLRALSIVLQPEFGPKRRGPAEPS
jgi:hypothetical protein